MESPRQQYYDKRGEILVRNLKNRHFDAYYCKTAKEALAQALALIPSGSTVGFGGAATAEEIGLLDAVRSGAKDVTVFDRDTASCPEERIRIMKQCLTANVFLTGANAVSLDGQMVNIDGNGNRVAAIVYGPDSVIVTVGMNKVVDSLEQAVVRARTIAAPMNKQRFPGGNAPCLITGRCGDCREPDSICNQILITRSCRPAGRIKFVIVGEDLGF